MALIVPGIYLAVRWYFVPQTVVIEGARGPRRSRARAARDRVLVADLRAVLLANLASRSSGFILLTPFTAIAESTDRAVWALVGPPRPTSVTTPFVALYSTLLYYDLLARRVA